MQQVCEGRYLYFEKGVGCVDGNLAKRYFSGLVVESVPLPGDKVNLGKVISLTITKGNQPKFEPKDTKLYTRELKMSCREVCVQVDGKHYSSVVHGFSKLETELGKKGVAISWEQVKEIVVYQVDWKKLDVNEAEQAMLTEKSMKKLKRLQEARGPLYEVKVWAIEQAQGDSDTDTEGGA